jgi:hypothetical protein
MQIHDYSPGNGTLYKLTLETLYDGKYKKNLLIWLNPSDRLGGICIDLQDSTHLDWDTLQRQMDIHSQADVAAILVWLEKQGAFSVRLPPGFGADGLGADCLYHG